MRVASLGPEARLGAEHASRMDDRVLKMWAFDVIPNQIVECPRERLMVLGSISNHDVYVIRRAGCLMEAHCEYAVHEELDLMPEQRAHEEHRLERRSLGQAGGCANRARDLIAEFHQ